MNKNQNQSLDAGLLALAQSPQYELIRTLEVSRLHPKLKRKKGTLENFVDSPPKLTSEQIEIFLQVIAPYLPPQKTEDGIESIKKSEAIGELEESLHALKKISDESVSSERIKSFLPLRSPSLPFEEMLTFKQLQEIGLENLVRKKGSHSEKFKALSYAIRSFIDSQIKNTSTDAVRLIPRSPTIHFLPAETPLSSISSLVVSSVMNLNSDRVRSILLSLSKVLREDEFATLLIASGETVSFSSQQSNDLRTLSLKTFNSLTHDHQDLLITIKSLLTSPGVRIEALSSIIGEDETALTLFAKFLFLITGAQHPAIEGKIFQKHFTLSQELFQTIYTHEQNKGTLQTGLLKDFFVD